MVYSSSISMSQVTNSGMLKELLEEKRSRALPLGSHLAEDTKGPLIESVTAMGRQMLKGCGVLITFDSSPRLDDAAAVTFSVCENWEIDQFLASFKLFGRPLNGKEWLDVILTSCERYQAPPTPIWKF